MGLPRSSKPGAHDRPLLLQGKGLVLLLNILRIHPNTIPDLSGMFVGDERQHKPDWYTRMCSLNAHKEGEPSRGRCRQ
jgi:hypothetical protein